MQLGRGHFGIVRILVFTVRVFIFVTRSLKQDNVSRQKPLISLKRSLVSRTNTIVSLGKALKPSQLH